MSLEERVSAEPNWRGRSGLGEQHGRRCHVCQEAWEQAADISRAAGAFVQVEERRSLGCQFGSGGQFQGERTQAARAKFARF
jgi:hypothetical protein